jgi:hypothetical protein
VAALTSGLDVIVETLRASKNLRRNYADQYYFLILPLVKGDGGEGHDGGGQGGGGAGGST